ncbi:MAG: hypothetical protein JWO04_3565 [Gammaproteobacteria bacterium]|nr:hypothetical protein [Gammaproteobacteria bacterium]
MGWNGEGGLARLCSYARQGENRIPMTFMVLGIKGNHVRVQHQSPAAVSALLSC